MLIGHFSFPSRAVLRKEYYVQSLSHLKTNKGEPCKSANWVKLPTDNGIPTRRCRAYRSLRGSTLLLFLNRSSMYYTYTCVMLSWRRQFWSTNPDIWYTMKCSSSISYVCFGQSRPYTTNLRWQYTAGIRSLGPDTILAAIKTECKTRWRWLR